MGTGDGTRRGRMVLIGGGARSGKSALALRLAGAVPGPIVFVATAQAFDGEMQARIDRHRDERSSRFVTHEEPTELAPLLASLPAGSTVVIDCLTLWLSNLLLAGLDDAEVAARGGALIEVVRAREGLTVLVSNEVGLGLVPDNALGRRFRDEAGRLHQRAAAAADEVYGGLMGLMMRLKPGPVEAVTAGGWRDE